MALLTLHDFEKYAEKHLDQSSWLFQSQGAERDETVKENERVFTRYRLIPRMLRNIPVRDFSTTVLGERIPLPIGFSPTGYQKLSHPQGELASAAAAAETGCIFTLSTVASSSLSDVANVVNGGCPLWFQVYILKDRRLTEEMIKKAQAKGYKALVMTIDTPVKGLQHRSWRNPVKLPPHIQPVNVVEATKMDPGFDTFERSYVDVFLKNLTWDDIAWVKSISSLPLVLKGIITVEDAVRAASIGAAGVWVSNHGGRQLDCVDTSLDVLPDIAAALEGTGVEVYMDGGIRWGTDILKALALGARCVFIGRPVLWGLTHSGKDGVRKIVDILKAELDRAMHLAGCRDIQDIGPHLVKKDPYSRL